MIRCYARVVMQSNHLWNSVREMRKGLRSGFSFVRSSLSASCVYVVREYGSDAVIGYRVKETPSLLCRGVTFDKLGEALAFVAKL